MLVRKSSYRHRKSGDDPAAVLVQIGPIRIWFSYNTPVAFRVAGRAESFIRRNDFSKTTGTHLNSICPDKKIRISGAEFEQRLHACLERFFFPSDLDKNTPVGIIADWLEEKGLTAAAEAVRKNPPN